MRTPPNAAERDMIYSALIFDCAQPLDVSLFYCEHGSQYHDCAMCAETPSYEEVADDPLLQRRNDNGYGR